MSNPAISFIIVSFNTKDILRECIESVRSEAKDVDLEVFVVDNISQDGTKEMLQEEYSNLPYLNVTLNNENLGFTKASNQPIQHCKGKYICFLNPDTVVIPGALRKLIDYLDTNPQVGVTGPKLLNEDGSLQISCGFVKSRLFELAMWNLLPVKLTERLLAKKQISLWDTAIEPVGVDWILGACLFIKRDLLVELGGFDEQYMFSAADTVDLCARVLSKGYQVTYFPSVEIEHKGGKSHAQASSEVKAQVLLKSHQGDIYYYLKYHGIFAATLIRSIFFLANLEKLLVVLVLMIRPNSEKLRRIFFSRLKIALKLLTMPATSS